MKNNKIIKGNHNSGLNFSPNDHRVAPKKRLFKAFYPFSYAIFFNPLNLHFKALDLPDDSFLAFLAFSSFAFKAWLIPEP